ncbi:hypothetical protein T4A_11149 [Trichinella pseudospiralis]|uniref:Uncharacterized protein n=1 Tax=Trichinella pseudospiralis TaxID=6337 RepID=A0A0V1ER13_TRIPS|nr:hypothetical protein T4A_11149 [Trichinella pseudospiralis]
MVYLSYSFSLDVGSDQTVTSAGTFFSRFMNEQAVGSCQLTAGTFSTELTLDEGPLSGIAWAHGGATCHCGDQHQRQDELKQKLVHLFVWPCLFGCTKVGWSSRTFKRRKTVSSTFFDLFQFAGKPIPNIGQSISSSQLLLQAVLGGLETSPHKTCPLHPFLTFSCPWQRPDIDLLEIMVCRQLVLLPIGPLAFYLFAKLLKIVHAFVLFCFERKSFNRACCCCSAIGTERGGGERERVDLISTHLQPTAIYH